MLRGFVGDLSCRNTHDGVADDTGQYLGGAGAIPVRCKPVAQRMDQRNVDQMIGTASRRRAPWECPAKASGRARHCFITPMDALPCQRAGWRVRGRKSPALMRPERGGKLC